LENTARAIQHFSAIHKSIFQLLKPMKRLLTVVTFSFLFLMGLPHAGFTETDGSVKITKDFLPTLTLREAIAKTLLHNPELAAFSLEKRVREARTLQSGLLPNPSLEISVEDLAGSGNFNGFGRSETTIQLGQLIELGGKRSARVQMSRLSEKLADWDYETKRMDVLTNVSKTFIDVLQFQQKVLLARDLVKLWTQFLNAVSERVAAGKVAAIEKTKAEVFHSKIQIDLKRTELELENARRNLSAFWGEPRPRFKSATGDLLTVSPVPSSETMIERLSNNPNLKRWATERAQRQATLDFELSQRVPDVTVRGGYRRFEETDDHAFTFGISVPLQLFDRNQGAIAEARNQLDKSREERRAAELQIKTTFLRAYNVLVFSHTLVTHIKTRLLPGAQKAFDAVNEGYRFGKFNFLDVLDSQKTLFQARDQYLDALADYHKAVAEVERLTGESLAITTQPSNKSEGNQRP